MGFFHGKGSVVSLDNTSAALTSISAFTDSVDGLPGEIELSEVTPFGSEGHKNIPGLEGASVTLSGSYDGAASAIADIVGSTTQRKAATRTLEYGPGGGASGAIKYSAEVWIQTFTVTSSVSEKVSWSMTALVDGVVTKGTYA